MNATVEYDEQAGDCSIRISGITPDESLSKVLYVVGNLIPHSSDSVFRALKSNLLSITPRAVVTVDDLDKLYAGGQEAADYLNTLVNNIKEDMVPYIVASLIPPLSDSLLRAPKSNVPSSTPRAVVTVDDLDKLYGGGQEAADYLNTLVNNIKEDMAEGTAKSVQCLMPSLQQKGQNATKVNGIGHSKMASSATPTFSRWGQDIVQLFKTRRLVTVVVLLLVALMGLIPPWTKYTASPRGLNIEKPAGYSFIFAPPQPDGYYGSQGVKVDVKRLLIQWVIVCAVAGAYLVKPRSRPEKTKTPVITRELLDKIERGECNYPPDSE